MDGEPVLVGGEYEASSVTKFDTGATPSPVALWGRSDTQTGVFGSSSSGKGVRGASPNGFGVNGESGTSAGVLGTSGLASGVFGLSGSETIPTPPLKTGVYGYAAQDENARGVFGRTTAGRGVYGYATSGTAVFAASADPMAGYALRAVGRVRLDRCAGIATIASGTSSVVVSPWYRPRLRFGRRCDAPGQRGREDDRSQSRDQHDGKYPDDLPDRKQHG